MIDWPASYRAADLVRRLVRDSFAEFGIGRRGKPFQDVVVERLREDGLLPQHERWGIQYDTKDGRVTVAVRSESAARDAYEEMMRRKRKPLVVRWFETDKTGVIYGELDRDRQLLQ